MRLSMLLNRDYTPYWKWLAAEFRKTSGTEQLDQSLRRLFQTHEVNEQVSAVEEKGLRADIDADGRGFVHANSSGYIVNSGPLTLTWSRHTSTSSPRAWIKEFSPMSTSISPPSCWKFNGTPGSTDVCETFVIGRNIKATLVLLIVCLTSSIILAQSEKVIVAVDDGYPPYMYGAEEGARGLYPRLIKAVFSRMGVEIDVRALPWKRALDAGERGEVAIGGIYKNKERMAKYDYSEPIFEETLAIYVRKGDAFPFKALEDLEGKTIGINLGWSYGEAFDEARRKGLFKIQEAKTNQANFQKLVHGRTDCLIVDRRAAFHIIRQRSLQNKVEPLKQPATVNHGYIAFAKSGHRKKLLSGFNRALSDLREDGSYEKIVDAFFSDLPRYKARPDPQK